MIGFVCGAFDLLHAGHIHLLKQCKLQCDYLIVALHVDPSKERVDKNKPIETIFERQTKLEACKFVDRVIVYEFEAEIPFMLKYFNIGVRFLGWDYKKGKPITGEDIVPIKYIDSLPIHTSNLRRRMK